MRDIIFKIGSIVLIILLCIWIGYLLFRPVQVKYVEPKIVRDTIYLPEVDTLVVPSDPEIVYYRDTLVYQDTIFRDQEIDSLTILRDYLSTRKYNEVLFDNDSIGKLDIGITVTKNRVQTINYNYLPPLPELTIENPNKYSVNAGIGISTANQFIGQLGFYRGPLGVSYLYLGKLDGDSNHGVTVNYRIGF